jgi:hypothetical protein
VVFGGTGDVVMPAVILGLRGEENLYLTEHGAGKRSTSRRSCGRYPFVFSSPDEGKTFTLCIDEGFPGFNRKGRGERPLYGRAQAHARTWKNVLKFLQQYQLEFRRTQALCKKLKDLNLLEPMRARSISSPANACSSPVFRWWTAPGSKRCRRTCWRAWSSRTSSS